MSKMLHCALRGLIMRYFMRSHNRKILDGLKFSLHLLSIQFAEDNNCSVTIQGRKAIHKRSRDLIVKVHSDILPAKSEECKY
jgi:hypothetical protein